MENKNKDRYKYFLPLNSANISQYFTRGLIAPSKLIEGWIDDIQMKFPNSILLSDVSMTDETNCSLTIVFSSSEIKDIVKISDSFYVYNKPLPISRINRINFKEEEQAKITKYNIEQGNAFVPDLISIVNSLDIANVSELDTLKKIDAAESWDAKLNYFNRVLGGIALMKIAKPDNYSYPKSYFNTLSFLNKEIDNKVKQLKFKNDFSSFLKYKKTPSDVYKPINVEYVTRFAKKENADIKVRRGLIQIKEIDKQKNKNSYLLAILATYGDDYGKMKKNSDFIASLTNNNFGVELKEELCLLFGINQGYSAFRNQYNIQDSKIDVKFKLDSELDYSIIESVYQYVFNDKTDNKSFSYISEWCPKFDNNVDLRKYETYRIFDKDIIYKKKAKNGSTEYFQELYQKFLEDSTLSIILNSLKDGVTDSIKNVIKNIFDKIKSDIEIENKYVFESKSKELQNEKDRLNEENKHLKQHVDELKKANNLLIEKEAESKKAIDENSKELENEIQISKDKNEQLKQQIDNLKSENNLVNLKEEESNKNIDQNTLSAESDLSRDISTEKSQENKKEESENQSEIEKLKSENKSLEDNITEYKNINDQLQKKINELENQINYKTEVRKNDNKEIPLDVDKIDPNALNSKIINKINSITDLKAIADMLNIENIDKYKADKKEILKSEILKKLKS